eukprot:scaffold2372_cov158-Amphora_coffeaeformis.AAC.1
MRRAKKPRSLMDGCVCSSMGKPRCNNTLFLPNSTPFKKNWPFPSLMAPSKLDPADVSLRSRCSSYMTAQKLASVGR